MIENMIDMKPLPVYGDGKNIRDWLYVEDHNNAVWLIANKGTTGVSYNIGGDNEWENIRLVQELCRIMAVETGKDSQYYEKLITYVKDRPGHDRRYAINCGKIKETLGWKQTVSFRQGLEKTVEWYLDNAAVNQVPDPSNHLTGSTSVFAIVVNGNCASEIVEIILTVDDQPSSNSTSIENCDDGSGSVSFDLISVEDEVNGGTGSTVNWYSDAGATVPINNPGNYISSGETVYAVVGDGI